MRILLTTLAAAGALFVGASSQASATTFSDGNFSNPFVGGIFQTVPGGSAIGPWTVIGDSVDLIGKYWQAPPVGGQSVDLDGNFPGGVSQTFNLTAGNHVLSFYLSANPDGASRGLPAADYTRTVDVSIGNQLNHLFTFSGSSSLNNMNYSLITLAFHTNGLTMLTFTSHDQSDTFSNSAFGPVIGGVSISNNPLPSTWLMLLSGFIGLGFFAYRGTKKRSAAIAAA